VTASSPPGEVDTIHRIALRRWRARAGAVPAQQVARRHPARKPAFWWRDGAERRLQLIPAMRLATGFFVGFAAGFVATVIMAVG
jgi:hypothetical protein